MSLLRVSDGDVSLSEEDLERLALSFSYESGHLLAADVSRTFALDLESSLRCLFLIEFQNFFS